MSEPSRSSHVQPDEALPSPGMQEPLPDQAEVVALESFVRLQKSQREYLEWLDATAKKFKIDQYTYRKIR